MLLRYLVGGDDLSGCFLHAVELLHEVPEPGARDGCVGCKEAHSVELGWIESTYSFSQRRMLHTLG